MAKKEKKEDVKHEKRVDELSRYGILFEVKSFGQSVDFCSNSIQAIGTCRGLHTSGVVFKIDMGTGIKNIVFRNEKAIRDCVYF